MEVRWPGDQASWTISITPSLYTTTANKKQAMRKTENRWIVWGSFTISMLNFWSGPNPRQLLAVLFSKNQREKIAPYRQIFVRIFLPYLKELPNSQQLKTGLVLGTPIQTGRPIVRLISKTQNRAKRKFDFLWRPSQFVTAERGRAIWSYWTEQGIYCANNSDKFRIVQRKYAYEALWTWILKVRLLRKFITMTTAMPQ